MLDEPIRQGRFPVVDVGDDAEVPYLFHIVLLFISVYVLVN
jgi:hypothetical protein